MKALSRPSLDIGDLLGFTSTIYKEIFPMQSDDQIDV